MSQLYRAAGVDIGAGDAASRLAYRHALATFANRADKIGQPVNVDGGFSGLIDMGPFCLTLNSDGVGSKAQVAWALRKFDTLGYDLVAMVADDACCLGAEPVALVNTLDMEQVDQEVVEPLMAGLEAAAAEARCAVVGGEIAELRDSVRGLSWSAACLGTVARDRVLDGQKMRAGDTMIGVHTDNFRANGFTLLRKILHDHLGDEWYQAEYAHRESWGEVVLAPSRIFTPLVLALTGGLQGQPQVEVHAVAHITGGGLRHNVSRVIPTGLCAAWDRLPEIPPAMKRVIDMGKVPMVEAERVWNLGVGLVVITPEPDACRQATVALGYSATAIGRIVEG